MDRRLTSSESDWIKVVGKIRKKDGVYKKQ